MNDFSVQKPVTYFEQIYEHLREMIFQGVYKPGDRIYEAKIAREFKISRSPVREAVRVLQNEGLLAIDDKSKITVYKPTIKDVEDIYQCRIVLESLAAKLTTELVSEDELQEIEGTLVLSKKFLESKKNQNDRSLIAENARFHDLITQYSQNNRLQKQINDLWSLSHYYRVLNFQGENRDWNVFNEHQEIFHHIKKRDSKKAEQAMAQHLTNDINHLKKILQNQSI
ncbi:GntR family transcriptional regulator [Metabacillus fastidiosus]|uniref:GntR family transcriptional regulator n=1 Tax=Metabacillus fastidiosus TaxID=1458 RepID=UPI003D2DE55F